MTSLNPVYTIGWQIAEAIQAHQDVTKEAAQARAIELLAKVGIPNPAERVDNYPHEFSGGMRQRAVIAIAMANDPEVILADEPTTALDVTVQAQVLDSLKTALDRDRGGAAPDHPRPRGHRRPGRPGPGHVRRRPVEIGTAEDVFYRPSMPYTLGLLGSLPRLDSDGTERLRQIPGAPPSMLGDRTGCPFAPRCPLAADVCRGDRARSLVVPSVTSDGGRRTAPPATSPRRSAAATTVAVVLRRRRRQRGRIVTVSEIGAGHDRPRALRPAAARGDRPGQALPAARRHLRPPQGRRGARGVRRHLHHRARARPSGSSASPAAASRPRGVPCSS